MTILFFLSGAPYYPLCFNKSSQIDAAVRAPGMLLRTGKRASDRIIIPKPFDQANLIKSIEQALATSPQ